MFGSCICLDVDGINDFFSERIVTAAKTHVCGECREDIPRGVKYERASGKCDGDFWTVKTCLACKNVRDSLFTCGFQYGSLWEVIHESICKSRQEVIWVCDCGAQLDSQHWDEWHWNGKAREHWHGAQAGYFVARKIDVDDVEGFCICPY